MERLIGQLSLKGPQTLEGLERKGQQIDFAISRLGIVLNDIGVSDSPSYLRRGRRDTTKHPLFEKLNARNFDSLPPLEKRDRFLQTAGIITDIAEIIIPSLQKQKSDLAERIAEAERMVEETEEVKKLKQILTGLEELKRSGVRFGDESISRIEQDMNYLKRNATIYFDSPTQPPAARTQETPEQPGVEKKPAQITVQLPTLPNETWPVPPIFERRPGGPSPRSESFQPKVSDIRIGILNRIINEPGVTVENVLDDLGIGLNKPVTVNEAVSDLKEAVNYLWLRINEARATADETELWTSIQILSGESDMSKALREFHALLEQWFEGPKKPRAAQETEPQVTTQSARQTPKYPVPEINLGPFPQEPSLKIVTIESAALARSLLHILPETEPNGKPIAQDVASKYPDQALALAIFTADLRGGKVKPITNAEIMQTADSQKALVAQNAIRQRLARLIIRYPDKPLEEYRYRWARDAREIIDWLGAGGVRNFAQAINNLPEFERAMVIAISSFTLLEDLGYLDLDECDEQVFASYIRNSAYQKQAERDDNLELLISSLLERSDAGTINPAGVLETLLEVDYVDSIFERLIESARLLGFLDKVIVLFSHHNKTTRLAGKLQEELLFNDSSEQELPRWRIMP